MGISLLLEAVVADAGRSLGMPWDGPCWLDVLGGFMSPRGQLLHVRPIVVSGREGSRILVLESLWRDDIVVFALLLLGVVAALDRELA